MNVNFVRSRLSVKRRYLFTYVNKSAVILIGDAKYVRLGHIAYNRFYKLTQGIKTKDKSYEEFSKSKYYTAFTKFGRHILDINAIDPEKFIDFVINNSVHLDKWCSDAVYETYIRELNKKETAERAIERGHITNAAMGKRT